MSGSCAGIMVACTNPEDLRQRGVGRDDVWAVKGVGVEHMHGTCKSGQWGTRCVRKEGRTNEICGRVAHSTAELSLELHIVLQDGSHSVPLIAERSSYELTCCSWRHSESRL